MTGLVSQTELTQQSGLRKRSARRVYASYFSQVNFPTSHPQFLGLASPGMPAGKALLEDADAVVAVGTPVFPGYFYFSGSALTQDTRLIHIDSDPTQIGQNGAYGCRHSALTLPQP